ncbi:MAG: hypothetical protein Q8936_03615 [Bacillota bacterium]|nr:hypothetical protein [Bacillota bacterium]
MKKRIIVMILITVISLPKVVYAKEQKENNIAKNKAQSTAVKSIN